jgi:hypothetical protein
LDEKEFAKRTYISDFDEQRMFNTIFPENFYKKCVFEVETDVCFWSIVGK